MSAQRPLRIGATSVPTVWAAFVGRLRLLPLMVAMALASGGTAEAHRMSVTVRAVGETLEGTARYLGGRPVAGASVEVRSTAGEVRATVVTDQEGRFTAPLSRREALEVVVLSKDGHAARARVSAEALPPAVATLPGPARHLDGEELTRQLREAVRGEVASQLVPIADQLARLEERIALRDVLGGLGYLVGLAGVAAYLLARQRGASPR